MDSKLINEKVLCILKYESNTKEIILDYIEIEDELGSDFNLLLSLFEKNDISAKNLVDLIKNHIKLKVLFQPYSYCSYLDKAFQGFYSTIEMIETKYARNFEEIIDLAKREELKRERKKVLLDECRQRLHAYNLEKAYRKATYDKDILAFSHRRVGWSAPKYSLNINFSIEFKTNFGFGSVSYFYTKIKYKNLDIVPFSDWINYRISKIYEIVRYSSKHRLYNESWKEAMQYAADAYNISIKDEALFIKIYIIDQCNELIKGLKNILINNHFKLKGYAFLNQERGYVDLKLNEHNLTEYQGEKISGALGLIEAIAQFAQIIEVQGFIQEIERCNLEIKPLIIKEKENMEAKLHKLNSEKSILDIEYNKMIAINQIFKTNKLLIKNELYKINGMHDELELEEEFNRKNPNFKIFKINFSKKYEKIKQITSEINTYEAILRNLIGYNKIIYEYFKKKNSI